MGNNFYNLTDHLRLHFVFSFLSFLTPKVPMSDFKRRSLILVFHSVLTQFKENYLLCFQGCGFSIQTKYKSHFLFLSISSPVGKARLNTKHVFLKGYDYC